MSCMLSQTVNAIHNQIPQGFSESAEEDELYEEAEDTQRQHSQFTTWYYPHFPANTAPSKTIIFSNIT